MSEVALKCRPKIRHECRKMGTERILTICRSIESICVPVKSSTGLKYTSVALTSVVVCLGTNTGSTYIFEKESLKLVKFISGKGGSIRILQFSKDGKLLAIVDSIGIVTCLEINEEKYDITVVKEIEDYKGAKITCLSWDDDSARLFIGDERGIITAYIVAPFKLPAGKFLSKSSVEVVVKGESPIVQLDYSKYKLLVSTTTRTLLCLTDRSKYQQIGSKPRDGRYGSCFIQYEDGEFPVIYAARPGSRLWEVDFHGQVLATHQFKYLLAASPKKIHGLREGSGFVSDESWDKPQAVAFPKLIQICKRYIISWSHLGLYIFDPSFGKIAGWFDEIKGITDISCNGETLYVICDSGQVLELEFMTVKNCLKCLIGMSEYTQAARVALQSRDEILKYVENFLSIDFEAIQEKLQESEHADSKELQESLHDLITQIHLRHDQVRAEIQERLNRIPSLDDSATPCDSGVEDNDDVKSNPSEVISESSSRLSLSRLPHIDVDRVLRKATNAVVNKIISSGFMKKALHDVLDEDSPRSGTTRIRGSPLILRRSPTHTDTNTRPIEEQEVNDSTETVTQSESNSETAIKEMGNVEVKALGASIEGINSVGIFTPDKRQTGFNNRRRKKAKIVTVDFESPEKEDVFKTKSYETSDKSHVRRLLSSDSANAYSPLADLKRLGSAPHHVNILDVTNSNNEPLQSLSKAPPQLPTDTTDSQLFTHANIIEKAKQLVRKVMQAEVPAPFDVKTNDESSQEPEIIIGRDSLSCLLVSENALRTIPKFVDFTAVCRNKLRDSRVLFNSTTVKKILKDWAEKLSDTVKGFSFAMANDIKMKNTKHMFTNEETKLLLMRTKEEFFQNLGAAFSEISNLAVLCYEAGIFPTSCSDLDYLEVTLIEGEKTLNDIRRNVNDILNIDDSKMEGDVDNGVPQESNTSTLLSLAESLNYSDGKSEKSFYINDEDSENIDSVNEKERLDLGNNVSLDENELTESENETEGITQGDALKEQMRENVLDRSSYGELKDGSLLSVSKDEEVVDLQKRSSAEVSQTKNVVDNPSEMSRTSSGDLSAKKASPKLLSSNALEFLRTKTRTSPTQTKEHTLNRQPNLRDYVNVPVPRKTRFFHEKIEFILCTSDDAATCQSCQEDFHRACFVLRFFPLLDVNKIRTVLSWKQGCRWRTWLACLIHLEDTKFSQELNLAISDENHGKVARILHDSTNIEQFFSCVRRLLPSSSSLVFDICAEKNLNPWEVSFIYMTNAVDIGSINDFLGYVSTAKRIKPSSNLADDVSVAMTILYCSLKETSSNSNIKSYYCDCGAAREGSHLLPWKRKSFIDDVLSDVLNSKDANCGLLSRMLDLCRRYGYWTGCIRILRHRGDHKHAFEIVSQLGDFNLLDQYIRNETFSIHDDDLKHLCSLIYHHTRDDQTKCLPAVPGFTPTIHNESLARLLVRELGPKEALKILKCYKEEEFLLTQEFFYECMKIAEKEIEQRQVIVKMMDNLINESYSENKSVLPRQIEQLKNRELGGNVCTLATSSIEDSPSNEVQNSSSSNHWGVSLNLSSSNCPCCTLPLCIHGASASAGLVVFECGHTFHKQCIPEEACLICYYKLGNFSL